jgi:KUP system potassium uptake protein
MPLTGRWGAVEVLRRRRGPHDAAGEARRPIPRCRRRKPEADTVSDPAHEGGEPRGRYLALLSLTALGVVYGDIGTSPLYAVRESFHHTHGLEPTPRNVLGVLSLIVWALLLVISVKYAVFVLRADNRGEGGILALTSLVTPVGAARKGGRRVLIILGLFGTALLYGDGMITPVMSVLSAVEGLEVATPFFRPYIVPITIGILVAIFLIQRHGTERVGKLFGPVTLLWFVVIAVLGVMHIVRAPGVFAAVNPLYGARFFIENGWTGFLVLGSVFLVVTGGEALYADMGHFGRRPIRAAWYFVALPALLLNYFGQGALLIRDPSAVENPFYRMVPGWALYPVVVIATSAAVIASQALITGAYSLTMQAVQLGYIPRVEIRHTSLRERGQIYIPSVNWILMISCIGLTLGFQRSTNVAAAYGVAVTTTMVITTLLLFTVERERWKWPALATMGFTAFFLAIDLAFWGASIVKIPHGGWFPLVVGAVIFTVMTTWKKGRGILAARLQQGTLPIGLFLDDVGANPERTRVPGTAVFMYGNRDGTPPALHVRQPRRDAAGAPPLAEALQGAARAGGAAERGDAGGAARGRGGARDGGDARPRLLPHRAGVRLHGGPLRPRRAGDREGRGAGPWSGAHHVLPRPRDADPVEEAGDGAVEGAPVRDHEPQREDGDVFLRPPAQPRCGAWRADRAVAGRWRRATPADSRNEIAPAPCEVSGRKEPARSSGKARNQGKMT